MVPSFRALSERLKFTVRRHKLNNDSLPEAGGTTRGGRPPPPSGAGHSPGVQEDAPEPQRQVRFEFPEQGKRCS